MPNPLFALSVKRFMSSSTDLQTRVPAKSTLRKYLLITLNHIERGSRSLLSETEIITRLTSAFTCRSIIICKETHKGGGCHVHIGVWNTTASKNTIRTRIRELFPEFEGRQCNVTGHKGWNSICKYLLKEDKAPVIWGEEPMESIMKRARAEQATLTEKTSLHFTSKGRPEPLILKAFSGFVIRLLGTRY